MNTTGEIIELDEIVSWRATSDDARCAVPLDSTKCLGALSGLKRARVHGMDVIDIDVKACSVYLKTTDGKIWHGIPDDNTAMAVAANDNPNYMPRPTTFTVLPPTPSQTLKANRDRVHKSTERRKAGLPPIAYGRRGPRPNTGRTLNMRPRGAVKIVTL